MRKTHTYFLTACIIFALTLIVFIVNTRTGKALDEEKSNYPSVMVLVDDYVDGVKQERLMGQAIIEEYFLANNFTVANKGRKDKINVDGITLFYANPKRSTEIARKYGADTIIVGRIVCDYNDLGKVEEIAPFAYDSRSDVKPIRVSDSEVLGYGNLVASAEAIEKSAASEKALATVANKVSKFSMARIAEFWRKEIYGSILIQLVCVNASEENITSLMNVLNPLREVRAVRKRSLRDNVLALDIRYFGTIEQLSKTLSNTNEPIIEVLNIKNNKIEIKVGK